MKRTNRRFLGSFLAALLIGGVVPFGVAPAAAVEELPQVSLSGVLDLPAEESRDLPLKDPFRSPILPPKAGAGGGADRSKAPEPPPLRLTAILQGPGRAAAVVNGTILRPGDTFLDMTVQEIAKNRVLFRRGEGKVTLFMQENLYNPLSTGGQ